MQETLRKIHWLLSQCLGLDFLRLFLALRGFPRFLRDYCKFKKNYNGKLEFKPCLHDRYEEGGCTRSEYFWQDLLVAGMIFQKNPQKHVDVGSSIDGFVAHVASFRELEIFDVRPVKTIIPRVLFRQADLMNMLSDFDEYCDSLSCLHALEHFGLGRYNDPVDTTGVEKGLKNMFALLKPNGVFYLSVPVGIERVQFNANWILNPVRLVRLAADNSLVLFSISRFKNNVDGFIEHNDNFESVLLELSGLNYSLCVFRFRKQS